MVIMPRENYFLPRFRGEFTHIVASAISLRQTASALKVQIYSLSRRMYRNLAALRSSPCIFELGSQPLGVGKPVTVLWSKLLTAPRTRAGITNALGVIRKE